MDLGSGSGALSLSAAKKWKAADFITVDKITKPYDIESFFDNNSRHSHFFSDVLSNTFFDDINIKPETLDVVLCNPPFISNNKITFFNVFDKVGLLFSEKEKRLLPVEAFFISQGLLALKEGGEMGLIVPDGIISGKKFIFFREALLKSHAIKTVIKLPPNGFHGTDAQAHIMIIEKNNEKKNKTVLKKISFENDFFSDIIIDEKDAVRSLDYSYHEYFKHSKVRGLSLRALGVKISRGKACSKEAKIMPGFFLHTNNFPSSIDHIDVYDIENKNSNHVFVSEGDIVMARVGRNFYHKIALISSGNCPITDCIFKIDAPVIYRKIIFDFLKSDIGTKALLSISHGVSARHISMQSLYELIIPLG